MSPSTLAASFRSQQQPKPVVQHRLEQISLPIQQQHSYGHNNLRPSLIKRAGDLNAVEQPTTSINPNKIISRKEVISTTYKEETTKNTLLEECYQQASFFDNPSPAVVGVANTSRQQQATPPISTVAVAKASHPLSTATTTTTTTMTTKNTLINVINGSDLDEALVNDESFDLNDSATHQQKHNHQQQPEDEGKTTFLHQINIQFFIFFLNPHLLIIEIRDRTRTKTKKFEQISMFFLFILSQLTCFLRLI